MMVVVAMPWFVLETTGSAAKTGLAGATIGFGSLISSLLVGPAVDRLGFKRASVLADVASGVTVAAIPLLYWAGVLQFWHFLALVFLASILNAPGDLARRALIPALARRAAMPIERANSADTAIPRAAQLAGPVLGGVLIVWVGSSVVLLLDAVTFSSPRSLSRSVCPLREAGASRPRVKGLLVARPVTVVTCSDTWLCFVRLPGGTSPNCWRG